MVMHGRGPRPVSPCGRAAPVLAAMLASLMPLWGLSALAGCSRGGDRTPPPAVEGARPGAAPGAGAPPVGASPVGAAPDGGAPDGGAPVRVGRETRFVYRTDYRPCGAGEEMTSPAPTALRGLDAAAVAQAYPNWHLTAFTAHQVILERRTDELCPEYRVWRHVRLEDGVVTVYYGRRDARRPILKERTDITVAMLTPADQRRLRTGVDLPGDAAVRAFLE